MTCAPRAATWSSTTTTPAARCRWTISSRSDTSGSRTSPGSAPEARAGGRATRRRWRATGLEPIVAEGDFTDEGGYEGARTLLSAARRPSAIFACNDLAAIGALTAIERAGLSVPGDVSLVGYDNSYLARVRHISLTSVDQPRCGDGAYGGGRGVRAAREPGGAGARAHRGAAPRRARLDGVTRQ
jgi:hypothetical protein